MIEIRHLKLLDAVAETGSLKNAAEKLFLSQSALSHQLRELESYLETPVFYRLNKQLVLTPSGKVLLDSSREILAKLSLTEKTIREISDGDRGTLRIMIECFTAYHWLPRLMQDFSRDFPKVEFSISYECNRCPTNHLISGELDIAIICDEDDSPLIHMEKIFDDEIVAVLPEDHPLADKAYLHAEDFENQHLLIHSFPLESVSLAKKVLIPEKINLGKVTQVPITDAALEMVKCGIGITTLPMWILNHYLQNQPVVGVPVTREGIKISWYAAMLKDAERPAYFDVFVSKMHEYARPGWQNSLHESFSSKH
ncbi:LysR family transcriptional regulator [Catalinimonas sp. 4WD22]|uniref:LysR family transcriptional regulator n=1 Tax=Catalinimonas locisalis TaxID=3133978 RepID=UPI0031010F3F